MLDLIIIGAGPYGISLAAHAVADNLSYRLFGYPMDFWKNQMPQDMFVRTPFDFVSFPDIREEFTIQRFAKEMGIELADPLKRTIFVEYAMWFAKKTGVEFTPELVTSLNHDEHSYTVTTETGEILKARNVVIATGVEHYKYVLDLFKDLPVNLVSHTLGYSHFHGFTGQKVAVIGSGQSAWEAAGLLHLAGAQPELIYRREQANYSGSREAEISIRNLGDTFYHLPLEDKREEWGQSPGSVAHFLRPYVEGKVPETGSTSIDKVDQTIEGKVRLLLKNGEERIVDHVISASGFNINLDHVPFLGRGILQQIVREVDFNQFPKLNEQFESSIPGLYFAGPLSSHSHGPTFRFILGLRKTVYSIVPAIVSQQLQVV